MTQNVRMTKEIFRFKLSPRLNWVRVPTEFSFLYALLIEHFTFKKPSCPEIHVTSCALAVQGIAGLFGALLDSVRDALAAVAAGWLSDHPADPTHKQQPLALEN
jgi:hypothetical protein